MVWHEGEMMSFPRDHDHSGPKLLSLSKWPDFFHFMNLLEDFLARQLTYPCDSADAFTGITRTLEPSFPGGFHYGLPELFFDIALLWQTNPGAIDRVDISIRQGKPTADLPTWSWVRWMGQIDLTAWNSANDHLLLSYYRQNRCVTTQIVEWFKIHQQTGKLKPISNNYREHRNCISNPGSTLARTPAPWERRDYEVCPKNDIWKREDEVSAEFTHPVVEYPCFRYPIPFPPESGFTADPGPWRPEIRGLVESVSLSIGVCSLASRSLFNLVKVQPADGQPVKVGVVRLHNAIRDGEGAHATSVYTGSIREFISISKGEYSSVHSGPIGVPWDFFDSWERACRVRDRNLYKFYNVMLIVRKEGFAERRGLGRVEASCWEALDRKREEITLR
jgi:hypothetical protein